MRTLNSPETLDFSSAGALTEIADAFGDTLTPSSYTGASCPGGDTCTGWTSSASGRELVLVVNVSGQLVQVVDPVSGLNATFAFSGTGCTSWSGGQTPGLCTATDPGGIVSSYTYDSGNATADLDYDALTATPPGATGQATITYTSGMVTQYQDPVSGQVTGYGYSGTNSSLAGGTTTVTAYPEGTGVGKPTEVTTDQYSSGVLVLADHGRPDAVLLPGHLVAVCPSSPSTVTMDPVNAANQASGSATHDHRCSGQHHRDGAQCRQPALVPGRRGRLPEPGAVPAVGARPRRRRPGQPTRGWGWRCRSTTPRTS